MDAFQCCAPAASKPDVVVVRRHYDQHPSNNVFRHDADNISPPNTTRCPMKSEIAIETASSIGHSMSTTSNGQKPFLSPSLYQPLTTLVSASSPLSTYLEDKHLDGYIEGRKLQMDVSEIHNSPEAQVSYTCHAKPRIPSCQNGDAEGNSSPTLPFAEAGSIGHPETPGANMITRNNKFNEGGPYVRAGDSMPLTDITNAGIPLHHNQSSKCYLKETFGNTSRSGGNLPRCCKVSMDSYEGSDMNFYIVRNRSGNITSRSSTRSRSQSPPLTNIRSGEETVDCSCFHACLSGRKASSICCTASSSPRERSASPSVASCNASCRGKCVCHPTDCTSFCNGIASASVVRDSCNILGGRSKDKCSNDALNYINDTTSPNGLTISDVHVVDSNTKISTVSFTANTRTSGTKSFSVDNAAFNCSSTSNSSPFAVQEASIVLTDSNKSPDHAGVGFNVKQSVCESQIVKNGESHIVQNGESHIVKNGESHIVKNGESHIVKNGESQMVKNGESQMHQINAQTSIYCVSSIIDDDFKLMETPNQPLLWDSTNDQTAAVIPDLSSGTFTIVPDSTFSRTSAVSAIATLPSPDAAPTAIPLSTTADVKAATVHHFDIATHTDNAAVTAIPSYCDSVSFINRNHDNVNTSSTFASTSRNIPCAASGEGAISSSSFLSTKTITDKQGFSDARNLSCVVSSTEGEHRQPLPSMPCSSCTSHSHSTASPTLPFLSETEIPPTPYTASSRELSTSSSSDVPPAAAPFHALLTSSNSSDVPPAHAILPNMLSASSSSSLSIVSASFPLSLCTVNNHCNSTLHSYATTPSNSSSTLCSEISLDTSAAPTQLHLQSLCIRYVRVIRRLVPLWAAHHHSYGFHIRTLLATTSIIGLLEQYKQILTQLPDIRLLSRQPSCHNTLANGFDTCCSLSSSLLLFRMALQKVIGGLDNLRLSLDPAFRPFDEPSLTFDTNGDTVGLTDKGKTELSVEQSRNNLKIAPKTSTTSSLPAASTAFYGSSFFSPTCFIHTSKSWSNSSFSNSKVDSFSLLENGGPLCVCFAPKSNSHCLSPVVPEFSSYTYTTTDHSSQCKVLYSHHICLREPHFPSYPQMPNVPPVHFSSFCDSSLALPPFLLSSTTSSLTTTSSSRLGDFVWPPKYLEPLGRHDGHIVGSLPGRGVGDISSLWSSCANGDSNKSSAFVSFLHSSQDGAFGTAHRPVSSFSSSRSKHSGNLAIKRSAKKAAQRRRVCGNLKHLRRHDTIKCGSSSSSSAPMADRLVQLEAKTDPDADSDARRKLMHRVHQLWLSELKESEETQAAAEYLVKEQWSRLERDEEIWDRHYSAQNQLATSQTTENTRSRSDVMPMNEETRKTLHRELAILLSYSKQLVKAQEVLRHADLSALPKEITEEAVIEWLDRLHSRGNCSYDEDHENSPDSLPNCLNADNLASALKRGGLLLKRRNALEVSTSLPRRLGKRNDRAGREINGGNNATPKGDSQQIRENKPVFLDLLQSRRIPCGAFSMPMTNATTSLDGPQQTVKQVCRFATALAVPQDTAIGVVRHYNKEKDMKDETALSAISDTCESATGKQSVASNASGDIKEANYLLGVCVAQVDAETELLLFHQQIDRSSEPQDTSVSFPPPSHPMPGGSILHSSGSTIPLADVKSMAKTCSPQASPSLPAPRVVKKAKPRFKLDPTSPDLSQLPRITGVSYDVTNAAWRGSWTSGDRWQWRHRSFAVQKYGFLQARQLAVQFVHTGDPEVKDEFGNVSFPRDPSHFSSTASISRRKREYVRSLSASCTKHCRCDPTTQYSSPSPHLQARRAAATESISSKRRNMPEEVAFVTFHSSSAAPFSSSQNQTSCPAATITSVSSDNSLADVLKKPHEERARNEISATRGTGGIVQFRTDVDHTSSQAPEGSSNRSVTNTAPASPTLPTGGSTSAESYSDYDAHCVGLLRQHYHRYQPLSPEKTSHGAENSLCTNKARSTSAKSTNSSGVTGVVWNRKSQSWLTWRFIRVDGRSKRIWRSFAMSKYGSKKARKLAIRWRTKANSYDSDDSDDKDEIKHEHGKAKSEVIKTEPIGSW